MVRSSRRLFAALAGPLAISLGLVACNGILGIDDYMRVECTGLRCSDGEAPIDGSADVADATRRDGGEGADPVSWARWPMPNYVLEAGSPPNSPDAAVIGSEVVDRITQLTWRAALENNGAPSNITDAIKRCRDIDGAGGWRVPKRIELVTLLDYGHTSPLIDKNAFVGFPSVRVWTSSEVREVRPLGPPQRYWVVDFRTGAVEQELGADSSGATLCVKAK